jgi:hypothetical protein
MHDMLPRLIGEAPTVALYALSWSVMEQFKSFVYGLAMVCC